MPLTKENFPDVMSYLGFDPDQIESVDKFKDEYSKNYIKKDPVLVKADRQFYSQVLGSYTGSIHSRLKKALKKNGGEWNEEEFKDKTTDEIVELAIDGIASTLTEKIKTLEESAGKGSDEKIKEYQEKLSKLEKDSQQKDQLLKSANDNYELKSKEWDEKEKSWASEKDNSVKRSLVEKLWSDFPFPDSADELRKEGFMSKVNSTVRFELTEDKKGLDLFDTDGNKIKNPNKAAAFLTPSEFLLNFGAEKGMLKQSTTGNQPAKKVITPAGDEPKADPRRRVNTLIPRA